MVLVNLGDEIIKKDRISLKFTAELSYCTEVAQKVKTFLEGELEKDTLLGIGVAIPGIIDQKERIVLKSHALGLENYSCLLYTSKELLVLSSQWVFLAYCL